MNGQVEHNYSDLVVGRVFVVAAERPCLASEPFVEDAADETHVTKRLVLTSEWDARRPAVTLVVHDDS
jgi:hypothetical protein